LTEIDKKKKYLLTPHTPKLVEKIGLFIMQSLEPTRICIVVYYANPWNQGITC
jgi:hypothetical protein